jgi:hypothetical protein
MKHYGLTLFFALAAAVAMVVDALGTSRVVAGRPTIVAAS